MADLRSKSSTAQLVAAAAVVCAGWTGPGVSATLSARAATFPVTHVNHVSMVVSDYARSRDFYAGVFGMRLVWDDGKMCALEFGDAAAPNGIYLRRPNPGEKVGVNHIAYAMTDFMAHRTAMKDEIDRRGLRNARPDGGVGWSFDDPAGFPLNVVVVKDEAMFPGAASVCGNPKAASCAAAFAVGLQNLSGSHATAAPALRASAFSHIVLRVSDVPSEVAFYHDMLGMQVIQAPDTTGASSLRFGRNTLFLRTVPAPAGKPVVDHFALLVDDWNPEKVKAALERRGLVPTANSALAWSIADPDGFVIEAAGPGLPEYVAAHCREGRGAGSRPSCPGGLDR